MIILRNGTLIDGTPSARSRRADVLIEDERIARVGRSIQANGARVIDASGLYVTPGFIDVHAHSDTTAFQDPSAQGRVADGVTSEINGCCGISSFPLMGPGAEGTRESLRVRGIPADWTDAAGYLHALEQTGSAINRGFMVGHGAIRAAVMGFSDKPASPNNLRRMVRLLEQSLEQGALGMSSGLCYPPGSFAKTSELVALARSLGRVGRPYCTHMRNEGRHLLRSVREALAIVRPGGASLHISHIKTLGRANWRKVEALERTIFEAQKQGISVTCDRYPFLAAATSLASVFPVWLSAGGQEKALKRLRSPSMRRKLADGVEQGRGARWDTIQISIAAPEGEEFVGLTMREVAARMNLPPMEAVFELLIRTKMAVSALYFDMCEENMARFYRWPFTYVGSDSSSRATKGPTARGRPHPRTFGTFGRFIGHYVLEKKLLPLPEAIARVTSMSAERFGLKDRGVIRPGAFADIAVFDPKSFQDTATYLAPFSLTAGVRHLLVNGKPVMLNGKQSRTLPGKILK